MEKRKMWKVVHYRIPFADPEPTEYETDVYEVAPLWETLELAANNIFGAEGIHWTMSPNPGALINFKVLGRAMFSGEVLELH